MPTLPTIARASRRTGVRLTASGAGRRTAEHRTHPRPRRPRPPAPTSAQADRTDRHAALGPLGPPGRQGWRRWRQEPAVVGFMVIPRCLLAGPMGGCLQYRCQWSSAMGSPQTR